MPPRQDLVARLNDQLVGGVGESLVRVIGVGGRLLEDGVRLDHLARHQVLADAEILQRTLGLRSPELVGGNLHFSEAVGFSTRHLAFSILPVLVLSRPILVLAKVTVPAVRRKPCARCRLCLCLNRNLHPRRHKGMSTWREPLPTSWRKRCRTPASGASTAS